MHKIICYGEILFDNFPDGKIVGGAPLNVALRLQNLGNQVKIISRRGRHQNGREIRDFLESRNFDTSLIQIDEKYPTGLVEVMLNEKGSASYDIVYPSAWDKIEFEPKLLNEVADADAFIFGSLVTRDAIARNTLMDLLDQAKYKIFDVNLRSPYYTIERLKELMQKADFIKLNDDELFEIAEKCGSPYNGMEQNIKYLADYTQSKEVCVTKGRHGAVHYRDGKLHYHSGFKIKVVDTVGAGDSFLATLVSKFLDNIPVDQALEYACGMGALIATHKGATTLVDLDEVQRFVYPM